MFGGVYFGQMYFAGAVSVTVIPPIPPIPPEGEGSAGGGGREVHKHSAVRSHHYRADLFEPDSNIRRLIEDARDQYAKEHPAKKIREIPARPKIVQPGEILAVQKEQKVCCAMSATFLIGPTNVDASVIQIINSRAAFATNKHYVQAQVVADASYSTGLTDEETISLLQLV